MPKVSIDPQRCKGCALCVEFCPQGHLRLSEELDARGLHLAEVGPESDCTGCKLCVLMCPDVAISIVREAEEGAKAR